MKAVGKCVMKEYKNKIFNSFSGGRSSGLMTKYLIDNYSKHANIVHIYANTGQEHESTLDFVNECDKRWGMNLVWVEAKFNQEKGKGTVHTITDYKKACRTGVLFDDMCKKYGIPNKAYPHCTRELKLQPMLSYIKSLGWKRGEYDTAIGLRSDEMDRVSEKFIENNFIYPLIDTGETKASVNEWWEKQDFNLGLAGDHWGNCTWCWKKSLKKHFALIREDASIFNVPMELEDKHGLVSEKEWDRARVFFRENMSTKELLAKSKEQLDMFWNMDKSFGCEESCEPIGTDNSPEIKREK